MNWNGNGHTQKRAFHEIEITRLVRSDTFARHDSRMQGTYEASLRRKRRVSVKGEDERKKASVGATDQVESRIKLKKGEDGRQHSLGGEKGSEGGRGGRGCAGVHDGRA